MPSVKSLMLPILLFVGSAAATFNFNDQFTQSPSFIDKSELFVELFRHRCDEPDFVTFPPKFGKSTNLQMLKKLLQFELDLNDQAKPMERTNAYHLVQNLKLAQQKNIYSKHLGQHPVILLDLKYDVEGEINNDKLVEGLTAKIQQIFKEYEWLGRKLQNSGHSRSNFFQNAFHGKLSREELSDSLLVLSEVLHEYFNQSKVVFLVDDFDYVSKYDFVKHYTTDSLYSMIHLIILKVAKAPYCHKRSLILSVSDRKVETPLYESIRQFPFLEEHVYARFFGILPAELEQLFERYKCSEQEKADVKKWYAGYQTDLRYNPIYNTYSIIEYFRNRNESNALRPYWAAVQNTEFIKQFLRVAFFRTTFNELLRYGVICCTIRKRRLLADKKFLPNMTDDKKDIRIRLDKVGDFVSFIFEHGHLSHTNHIIKEGSYKIPNWEIENLLIGVAMKFYQSLDIPVTKLGTDLMRILHETNNSTIFSLTGAFEWNLISIVSPIQKAGFLTTTELEHFSVIYLAVAHIKITVPGTEVIVNSLTCTPRDDIVIISNGKAMMVNFDGNPNRLLPSDEYMCKCIKDRNFTKIKLLGVTLNSAKKAECLVHSVDCSAMQRHFY